MPNPSVTACTHLCSYVLVTWWTDKRETNQEHICLGIREGTESVVIFLTGGIPEPERYGLSIHHDIGGVVVKH